MKEKILVSRKRRYHRLIAVMLSLVSVGLASYVIVKATVFSNEVRINDAIMPELDAMSIVKGTPLKISKENGVPAEKTYQSYDELKQELGIPLLHTPLAIKNPYSFVTLNTDNKNYAEISVDNYIIGDVSNFVPTNKANVYQFSNGDVYYSPVSLYAEIILSEEQLATGMETDYLGMYEYLTSYTSAQGYKVNILQETGTPDETDRPANYQSRKDASFVANGIRYTLSGSVSLDTMKEIVDSMSDQ